MSTNARFCRRLPSQVLFLFLLLTLPLLCMPALGQRTKAEKPTAALAQDKSAGPQVEEDRSSSAEGAWVIELKGDPIPKMDPVIALLQSLTANDSMVPVVIDTQTGLPVPYGRMFIISQGNSRVKIQPRQGNRTEPHGVPEAIEQGMQVDAIEHKQRLINPRRIEAPRPENPWEIRPLRIQE